MRYDGDHTPEDFEKARRMEDVGTPVHLTSAADEFDESDEWRDGPVEEA